MNVITLFMLNSLLLISSMIFSNMKHPLSMGFLLLIQTILVAMISGMLLNSFWFSYILFLVFLGGMLVLFIYVTSLASNDMFKLSMKLTYIYFIVFMIILIIMFMMMDYNNFMFIFNYESFNNQFLNLNINNSSIIYKLYNFPMNWLTCLMINYLFITLIVVVKVTNFFFGPIRSLN